jgi:DNA-binding MarR family transcriptional regulator
VAKLNGSKRAASRERRPAHNAELDADLRAVLDGLRTVVKILRIADRAGIKQHGLGSAQLYVLHQLARDSPLAISELAELTSTDQSSVSVVVNKLVEKGYVSSARSREDLRKAALTLTGEGRRILRDIPPPFQQTLVDSLSHLSRARVRELGVTLQALAALMGVDDPHPPMFFDDGDDEPPAKARPAAGAPTPQGNTRRRR